MKSDLERLAEAIENMASPHAGDPFKVRADAAALVRAFGFGAAPAQVQTVLICDCGAPVDDHGGERDDCPGPRYDVIDSRTRTN